jgi:hypothetical protein
VGLEGVLIGPLLDEHERLVALVHGVQVAARLFVDCCDGRLAGLANGVDRFGLDGEAGNDDDGHGRAPRSRCDGAYVSRAS